MKSFKTHIEENKDHVETHMDVMVPDSHDTPTKAKKWISNYVKKKGGPSNKLSHYTYDGPGGGHPAVSVKGHVSHIMKLHNHHNDEKFSHDHEGHKKMSKEYGFDKDKNHLMKRESVNEKSEFGMAHDIVQKHSKQSEVRGSGDGITVTAEHPRGQNASKADRAAHTNMMKKKLSHLRGVKVVQKTYPGSATESVTKTPGDKGYYYLQRAKKLAAADGHNYDKLPQYHRGANVPHKEKYMDKAKNEAKLPKKSHAHPDPPHVAKSKADAKRKADAAAAKSKAMGTYSSQIANPGMSFVGYRSKFD